VTGLFNLIIQLIVYDFNLLSIYSTSIVQELALKYIHNRHSSIKDRHYKSLSLSTSGAFLDRVSCNIRHHQHDSEAISRGIIADVPLGSMPGAEIM
jgi:hypothetical protein